VPVASSIGLRPGYFAGSLLGAPFDPFETEGDPNSATFKVQNLQFATYPVRGIQSHAADE
jgi:hypothetical protein